MQKITIDQIERLVKDTLLLEDKGIIKLVLATVIANRFFKNPVWVMLVAPSSGGKTAILQAIRDCNHIHFISSLTSKTFISGFKKKGEESSYLFKIQNGILIFKDFTTILNEYGEERSSIMSQLREIYDGDYAKSFGTGEEIKWRGHLGIIAGGTFAVYTKRKQWAPMGERFMLYSIDQPDRVEVGFAATKISHTLKEREEAIREAFKLYLDENVVIPAKLPELPPDIVEELVYLVEFATRARSPVERDENSFGKDITGVSDPEMTPRFLLQLLLMGSAMMIMTDGNLTSDYKRILYKLAFDSIDFIKRKCLSALFYSGGEFMPTKYVATKIFLPTKTVHMHLEDLNALEVVIRRKEKGNRDSWMLTRKYHKIIQKYQEYEILPSLNLSVEESLVYDETETEEEAPIQEPLPPLQDEPSVSQEDASISSGETLNPEQFPFGAQDAFPSTGANPV